MLYQLSYIRVFGCKNTEFCHTANLKMIFFVADITIFQMRASRPYNYQLSTINYQLKNNAHH